MHADNNQSMIRNFAVKICKKQTRQKSNWRKWGSSPVVDPPFLLHSADNFDRKIKKQPRLFGCLNLLLKSRYKLNVTDSPEILSRQGIYNKKMSEKANEIKTCFLAEKVYVSSEYSNWVEKKDTRVWVFFHSPTFRTKFSFSLSV